MNITEETKTEVTVENVVPISLQIGMCQEDKFEVELEKEQEN